METAVIENGLTASGGLAKTGYLRNGVRSWLGKMRKKTMVPAIRPWLRVLIRYCVCLLAVVGSSPLSDMAAEAETKRRQEVPVIDAEAGPCSVEMTVTDVAVKPVYAAIIRVHISHGFLGMRKSDLEIGTNVDGKAKFVGLPQDTDELLYFRASKGRQTGIAVHSTAKNCDAEYFIVLRRR